MKIQHLLEYKFPNIQTVNVAKARHPGQRGDQLVNRSRDMNHVPRGAKHMGAGEFSTVYKNEIGAPHDVRKISKPKRGHAIDGFYFYIKALEAHNDNTNPYFPRFRNIKIYVDNTNSKEGGSTKNDIITYSASMEHLYPIYDLSNTELNSILARMFGTNVDLNSNTFKFNMGGRQAFDHPLVNIINGAIDHRDADIIAKVVDKDFLRAASFIAQVADENSVGIDLHGDNIMYRKTPYGSQLVISDPMSFQNTGPR